MVKKKDGRVVAKTNEIRVLRALQRFGWIRTKDIAILCWTRWVNKPAQPYHLVRMQPRESALRMSQRTMKRLLHKRCVLASAAPDGSVVYALAEAGVRALGELGLKARSGKDLTRGFSAAFFQHRCIANEIAIAAITQGFRVSTEREIAQSLWLGGSEGIDGKRPDVLIRDAESTIFVEVEKSRKNKKDYQALVEWLTRLIAAQGGGGLRIGDDKLLLSQIIFVCTRTFQIKLQKDLQGYGWSVAQQNTLIQYSTDLYMLRHSLFL